MQIFAQGIMGLSDMFIHPGYISAVSSIENDAGPGLIAFIIGTIIFCWAIFMYLWFKEKRKKREEEAETEISEVGPP
jgi:H+/gluconate symporter-like permease